LIEVFKVRDSIDRFHSGIEYWAEESVQEWPDQRALMRSHIRRTNVRFVLGMAGFFAIVLSSLALEYLRSSIGGTSITAGRWLIGMVPGVLALVAILGISAALLRHVYSIRNRNSAWGHAWLLLFGRAPFSILDELIHLVQRFLGRGKSDSGAMLVTPYPFLIVEEAQIRESQKDTLLARLGGPGNVIIFNDSAVFLEQFGRFTRVAGPGGVFLRRFERIREVLDLRPQERSEIAKATTKDGILVQAKVQVRFQLARPPEGPFPPKPGVLDPAYKWAWTQAGQCQAHLAIPELDVDRVNHWSERVMGNVSSTMRAIVDDYRLDELLEPYDPDRDPRREIAERLHTSLDTAARNFGAEVLEVRMEALKPTLEEVEKKRVAAWRATWKSLARRERAEGEAEAIRERGLARAYAQMEIILALTQEFQELVEHDMTLSAEFVALRFIEALRQMWTEQRVAVVPSEAIRTLERLHYMVRRDYSPPGR
jgi:regulator of protease activity HflC (stomatin/prohibitin superfamily)